MVNEATFDYVIVGGGSAGALLAARLSEKPDCTVALLEAGPKDRNPFIHLPAGFIKVIFSETLTWGYETEPGPYINNRRLPAIQGRVLGGSGSVNGMVIVRGQRGDFDGWAEAGAHGWSYEDVLPVFRRMERRIDGSAENAEARGGSGELPVRDLNWNNDLVNAFLASAEHAGIPANSDYNGISQEGVGRYQYNIDRGWRKGAAQAFLSKALGRGNLTVMTDALAMKIELDGTRATGVTLRRPDGTTCTIRARKEVILSCGALNSPRLLQLSGIGPGQVLRDAGIAVRHELPGVGENLHDHFTPRFTYLAKDCETINDLAQGPKLWREGVRWLTGRPSILGIGVVLGAAFARSRPELNRPDVVVTFTPGTFKAGFLGRLDDVPGMTTGVWGLRPEARGYVRVTSADSQAKPSIQPNFMGHEKDVQTVLDGMKLVRQIMDQPGIAKHVVEETMPGRDIRTDDELLDYARSQGLCGYHYCGTARMGRADDPMSVVGSDLRVKGLQGLRVVDASVMPSIVSGNTNAATMMIAEKAAEMIAA